MKTFKKTSAKLEFYEPSPISLYTRITTQSPCKVAQFTPIPGYFVSLVRGIFKLVIQLPVKTAIAVGKSPVDDSRRRPHCFFCRTHQWFGKKTDERTSNQN